ncbi:MAG: hypothetical protein ABJG15_01045 [Hyphomonadaceae bacterium]
MIRKVKLGHLFRDMWLILRLQTLNILLLLVATAFVITAVEIGLAAAFEPNNANLVSFFATVVLIAPVGVIFYRRALGIQTTDRLISTSWSLALAQILVYLLFVILTVFALMLLVLMTGIMAAAGGFDPSAIDFNELELGAAASSLGTTGQFLLSAIVITTIFSLIWVGVRLTIFGVATVAKRRVMVFRTWAWTKGNAWRIAIFYLVVLTPVVLLAIWLSDSDGLTFVEIGSHSLHETWLNSIIANSLRIIPSFLIGHAAALAVYRQLAPVAASTEALS